MRLLRKVTAKKKFLIISNSFTNIASKNVQVKSCDKDEPIRGSVKGHPCHMRSQHRDRGCWTRRWCRRLSNDQVQASMLIKCSSFPHPHQVSFDQGTKKSIDS